MPKNTTKQTETTTEAEVLQENTVVSEEVSSENNETVTNNEIVEVEWDQVQPVFEFRQRLQNLEAHFSNMCLQYEKSKANLMNQIVYGQTDLYSMAQKLQKDLNIDANLTYELKLPATAGEKGYFLRKDT